MDRRVQRYLLDCGMDRDHLSMFIQDVEDQNRTRQLDDPIYDNPQNILNVIIWGRTNNERLWRDYSVRFHILDFERLDRSKPEMKFSLFKMKKGENKHKTFIDF